MIRLHEINTNFYPFLVFIWAGAINEIFSTIIINLGFYNIFNYNLSLLIESVLLLWQFHKWGLFKDKKYFTILFLLFVLSWLSENIFISGFYLGFNSYFRIFCSFIIVLLSLSILNQEILKERKNLLRNSIFIICCGIILMYTYAVLTESFIVYGVSMNDPFSKNLYRIFIFINLFCNIIYAIAILWMPKKQAFTLQY